MMGKDLQKPLLGRHKNALLSAKQIVQDKFSLYAFRMLVPVNALGRYHSHNDILVSVCCLGECPDLAFNVILVLGGHSVWSVPELHFTDIDSPICTVDEHVYLCRTPFSFAKPRKDIGCYARYSQCLLDLIHMVQTQLMHENGRRWIAFSTLATAFVQLFSRSDSLSYHFFVNRSSRINAHQRWQMGKLKYRLCLNNLNQILNFVVPRPLYDCQKIQQSDNKESIIG